MHAYLGIFRHATQFFIVLFPERLFATNQNILAFLFENKAW